VSRMPQKITEMPTDNVLFMETRLQIIKFVGSHVYLCFTFFI